MHNGIENIRYLRTGRKGIFYHRLEEMGCNYHKFSLMEGFFDDSSLIYGEFLDRNLDSEISPSHHNPIGRFDDPVEIFYPLLILDLGYNLYVRSIVFLENRAEFFDIFATPHEAHRDKIISFLDAEEYILSVLLHYAWKPEAYAGEIHMSTGPDETRIFCLDDNMIRLFLLYMNTEKSGIYFDILSDNDVFDKVRIVAIEGFTIIDASRTVGIYLQDVPLLKSDFRLDVPCADFRSFGIEECREIGSSFFVEFSDSCHNSRYILIIGMGKVEPDDIRPRIIEGDELLFRFGRRTNRGDNLRFFHKKGEY